MKKFKMEDVRKQVLLSLRGNLSQLELNSRLGYRSNQIYRWESGQSAISWNAFCDLCENRKAPLREACRRFLAFTADPKDYRALVKHLGGPRDQGHLAKLLGVSRSVISRWQTGKTEPSLEQIFTLIDSSAQSFTEFVHYLCGEKELPSIQRELQLQRRERKLHFERPWVAALLLLLMTEEYLARPAHDDQYVTDKIGVTIGEEKKAIKDLLEVGAIYLRKKHYTPRLRNINLAGNRDGNLNIRRYWHDRLEKLLTPTSAASGPVPAFWPYMVFSTDEESYKKIRKKIVSLFEEIQILSLADRTSNDIYVFSAQLVELVALPKSTDNQ